MLRLELDLVEVRPDDRTSPEILARVHRTHAYPDYFAQELAANPSTPPAILRELSSNVRITGHRWLLRNPSTPKDVLERLLEEEKAQGDAEHR